MALPKQVALHSACLPAIGVLVVLELGVPWHVAYSLSRAGLFRAACRDVNKHYGTELLD